MRIKTSRIPGWFGAQAMTVSPSLVLIVPERANDQALIEHEKTHVRQQEAYGCFVWWVHYLCSKHFRLEAEIEAYQVQIRHGASLPACARNLATMYRLGISYEQAEHLLTQ